MERVSQRLVAQSNLKLPPIPSGVTAAKERALHAVRDVAMNVASKAERLTTIDEQQCEDEADLDADNVEDAVMMLGESSGKRKASEASLLDELDQEAKEKCRIKKCICKM